MASVTVWPMDSVCMYAEVLMLMLVKGCQQWTLQPNTNYANGQGNRATSVQQCQAACIANTTCNGFDWAPSEPAGRQCWLSGSWSGARGNPSGVTHYVLDRNCRGNFDLFIIAFLSYKNSKVGGVMTSYPFFKDSGRQPYWI